MDWKDLRDGSLRIEQHLITHKDSQRRILVGKNGSKIGYAPICHFYFLYHLAEGLGSDIGVVLFYLILDVKFYNMGTSLT